jgi:hypothetical protein
MSRKLLTLFFAFAILPFSLYAATGKIAGVVTDKDTGEPLVGVNIYIEDSSFGSATDADGYYVILGVAPGSYDLVAEYVGYHKLTVQGLRVFSDVTTSQNYEMVSTAIELDNLIVTAERDLVRKNVTSSISVLEASDIEQLPVRGLTNLIALQPSVVVQDGNVHIRGSRRDEVGYYLDGADIANPVSQTRATTVINEAVEELAVESGTYDAEFGGANGGLVRTELRTGGDIIEGSIDVRTDALVSTGESFLGANSNGYTNFVGTIGGPIPGFENIRLFIAQEINYTDDQDARFYEPFAYYGLEAPNVGEDPNDFDLVDIVWDGKSTPNNEAERYTTNATALLDFKNIKIKVGGAYTYAKNRQNDAPIINILNDRGGFIDFNNLLLNLKGTYVLNDKMFIEARTSYFYNSTERLDDWFGNAYRDWFDPNKSAARGSIAFENDRLKTYDVLGFYMSKPGTPYGGNSTFYQKQRQEYYAFAASFTGQFGKNHEIKAGIDGRFYEIRRYSINANRWNEFNDPETWNNPAELARTARVNNYGYDVYGNDQDSGLNGSKKPVFFSAFLQDKLEYEQIILKLGLRFDYFDAADREFVDPADVDVSNNQISGSSFKSVDPFMELSPRITMSFPASEKTVFYTGYGKNVQMSQLQNIYSGTYNLNYQMTQSFAFLNPVGLGLEPTVTTNYEFGVRQQLGDNAALDVSAFYRNIKGQIQPVQIISVNSDIGTYNSLQNGTFATNKGLEMKLTLRRTNRVQTQVNYTYTDAEGTGSFPNSAVASLETDTETPTVVSPLTFTQKHRGSILLDYRFGQDDGGPILERLGANLIFTFNSGHPFTRSYGDYGQASPGYTGIDFESDTRARRPSEPINESTTPWVYNFDFRLDKTFDILDYASVNVYFEVLNLFDTKNTINVYSRTGVATTDGFIDVDNEQRAAAIGRYGEEFIDFYKAINIDNGEAYRDILGIELWDTPRQTRLGVKFTF